MVSLAIASSVVVVACSASAAPKATAADAGCLVPGANVITVTSKTKPANLAPGNHVLVMRAAGFERCVLLFVPQDTVASRPLVLVFHGATDTASSTEETTDFQAVAEQSGDVVAFLQGYDNTWNDGAGATDAERAGVNDVRFTSVAIAALEKLVHFDHKRIVGAGFSNGALMVEDLGCKLTSQFALIVPVEGQLPVNVAASCAPSRPVSVYEVHGTDDTAIPYGGGTFHGVDDSIITVLSAPGSAKKWAKLDHCSTTAVTTYPSSQIRLDSYGSCRSGAAVVLRTIIGGVHEWGANIAQLVANATPES